MGKKLITRSQFAELAGVRPPSITKVCKTRLREACEGKRIDANHPAALAYLEDKAKEQAAPVAPGIDPRYEEAINACEEVGRYSINTIQKKLGVSFERARGIFETMKATKVVPSKEAQKKARQNEEPEKAAEPKLRGHASIREEKKQAKPIVETVPEHIQEFADMSLRTLIQKFGTDLRFLDWLKSIKTIEEIEEKRIKNASASKELVSRKLIRVGILDPIEATHRKLLADGPKRIAARVKALTAAGAEVNEIEKFISEEITSFLQPMKSKVTKAMRDVES